MTAEGKVGRRAAAYGWAPGGATVRIYQDIAGVAMTAMATSIVSVLQNDQVLDLLACLLSDPKPKKPEPI
jgi:hypothetical protein